jgi:hypothetical protein
MKIMIDTLEHGFVVRFIEYNKDLENGTIYSDTKSYAFEDLDDLLNCMITEIHSQGSYDEDTLVCINIPGRKFEGEFRNEKVIEDRELAKERYRLKDE